MEHGIQIYVWICHLRHNIDVQESPVREFELRSIKITIHDVLKMRKSKIIQGESLVYAARV